MLSLNMLRGLLIFTICLLQTGCDFFKISPKALVFKTVDGEKVAFKPTNSDRFILFHFWASWCSVCIEEMPSFISFAEQTQSMTAREQLNFEVVFVAMRDEIDKVRKFDRIFGISSLTDPLGGQLGKYGVFSVPATFLVNSKLQVVAIPDPDQHDLLVKVTRARNWTHNNYPEVFARFLIKLARQ